MKIRNIVKSLALVGATAALLPVGNAVAGGPGFDNIVLESGSTGDLSGCPSTASCTPLISGEGFLQQEVRLGTETYIQTVIIDPLSSNAAADTDISTLSFSDITFIQMSGSTNGIKGLQRITDDPLTTNAADTSGNLFSGTTELLIGAWADDGDPLTGDLAITQSFRDNSGTGTAIGSGTDASQTEDDFVNTFSLDINLDGNTQLGKKMDMQQDVGMSDPTVTSPGDDFQRFVIRQRSGDLLTAAGSLELGPASAGTTSGGTVEWTDSEDVMMTWLGQRVNLGGTGSAIFGFQSVDNRSDSVDPISTFSTSSAGTDSPFTWDTNFGDAPSL